jgi:hypothetical protein
MEPPRMKPPRPRIVKPRLVWRLIGGNWTPFHRVTWRRDD